MISKKTGIGIGLFGCFVLYVILVITVDVEAIGPNGTSVGLSHLNQAILGFFGSNTLMYELTELIGVFSLGICLLFGLMGLIQLIGRRGFRYVDQRLYALAGLYVFTAFFYALFEKVVINYRPVIMEGETAPEASFPSSHTMLVCVVMESTVMMLEDYIKPVWLRRTMQIVCIVLMVATIVGRMLSGVHWFTDIVGGVLLSAAMLVQFSAILSGLPGPYRKKAVDKESENA